MPTLGFNNSLLESRGIEKTSVHYNLIKESPFMKLRIFPVVERILSNDGFATIPDSTERMPFHVPFTESR